MQSDEEAMPRGPRGGSPPHRVCVSACGGGMAGGHGSRACMLAHVCQCVWRRHGRRAWQQG
eukprot:356239-Chlamydomonas_euryale.AAC.1